MVDVFISYSRDNQDAVRGLAEAVKREGYAIWWDDELPAHRPYGDVITEKIDAAKAAIVVWSRSSATSEWVRAEADLARNQKKLIQASIDDRMPPMPFNQIQFASIGDWNGEDDHPGWRKIKASLTALCGPRGAVAPVAPRMPVPVPVPAPPPPIAAEPGPAPPSPRGGPNRLLVGLIAASLLVIATVAVLALTRGRADAPADRDAMAADSPMPAAPARMEPTAPAGAGAVVDDQPRRAQSAAPAMPAAAPRNAEFSRVSVISDPDGYTNVRAGPSADAQVVATVNEGEEFTTHDQAGHWWRIKLPDGRIGYMARSRIRMR